MHFFTFRSPHSPNLCARYPTGIRQNSPPAQVKSSQVRYLVLILLLIATIDTPCETEQVRLHAGNIQCIPPQATSSNRKADYQCRQRVVGLCLLFSNECRQGGSNYSVSSMLKGYQKQQPSISFRKRCAEKEEKENPILLRKPLTIILGRHTSSKRDSSPALGGKQKKAAIQMPHARLRSLL